MGLPVTPFHTSDQPLKDHVVHAFSPLSLIMDFD